MYGTEVKLDALADPDGAGAQNQHLLPAGGSVRLILTAEAGVVIRRLSRKLSGAGIHHLEGGADVVLIAHGLYLILGKTCEPCDHVIREFDAFCFL